MKWVDNEMQGMAYQYFRVAPFKPLNDETRIRVKQLRNDLHFVKSLSVLDIGCHAGLASLMALEMGAQSVKSTDIDITFLKDIENFVSNEKLPCSVKNISFNLLDKNFESDAVLLMEVYHWLAHQGLSPDFVSDKLNILAKKFIYIETPFDRTDPSIVRAMGEKSINYRIDIVLNNLIKKGWSISFLGMTEYFPDSYNRGRFLAFRNT